MLLVRLKSSLGVIVAKDFKLNEGGYDEYIDAHSWNQFRFSDETIFDLSIYSEFSFGKAIVIDDKDNDKELYAIECIDFYHNRAISFIFKEEAMGEYQKLKRILEDRLTK